jgi:S-adenosylmethionine:tRNA ribosyltransferase-isomerase
MKRTDFFYELPTELIAQYPLDSRTDSRLLYLNSHAHQKKDLFFIHFPSLLSKDDLLVFNDTRVIPARLFGHKATGGQIEILVERVLDKKRVLAQLRASKPPKPGSHFYLEENVKVIVKERLENFFELQFEDSRPIYEILQTIGHIPLPPYIKRSDTIKDNVRYQTVYAKQPGAIAAPTAGLHFDETMLNQIEAMGIEKAFITLHVGAGTFAPIRVNDIAQHTMHAEQISITAQVCEQINATRARGGRIIAIGTTTVRALETASTTGTIKPYEGETRLFITPGYHFQTVDALLTNFHLPESTLLMLVCAFGGQTQVLDAYQHAVAQKYRFFSYGDAMFVEIGNR